jgi:hypothetical protein
VRRRQLTRADCREPGIREVIRRPAASDHVSSRPKRGATVWECQQTHRGPRAGTRAGYELSDCAANPVPGRTLVRVVDVAATVGLDEGLPQYTSDALARQRPGRLERGSAEEGIVERRQRSTVSPKDALNRSGGRPG